MREIITQKELSGMLKIPPSHLNELLSGARRSTSKGAGKLEALSGVDRLIWRYGSKRELIDALEDAFDRKINFSKGRPPLKDV